LSRRKPPVRKVILEPVWTDRDRWVVRHGRLARAVDHPPSVFKVIGEKLPWACFSAVNRHLKNQGLPRTGVYVAHDALGYPRYVGRGKIFPRLRSHKKVRPNELAYFSFYVVDAGHERDIETLLIRTAGPLLDFNNRKKRVAIEVGRLRDYPGPTLFYERHRRKGKRRIVSKAAS